MKKLSFLFVFIAIVFSNAFSQNQPYEEYRQKLFLDTMKSNNIKSWAIEIHDYKYGVPVPQGRNMMKVVYNAFYQPIEITMYDDGDFVYKQTYQYHQDGAIMEDVILKENGSQKKKIKNILDDKGRIVEAWFLDSDQNPEAKEKISYDNDNNKIELTRYTKENIDYKNTYTYNEYKLLADIQKYNDKGELDAKTSYKYNESGQMTDESYYENENLKSKTKKTYDLSGNLASVMKYKGSGKLIDKVTYKYNHNKSITEIANFDSDQDPTGKILFTYRKNGQLTQIEIYGKEENLIGTWKMQYYPNGLLRQDLYLNKIEEPEKLILYKYDPEQIFIEH